MNFKFKLLKYLFEIVKPNVFMLCIVTAMFIRVAAFIEDETDVSIYAEQYFVLYPWPKSVLLCTGIMNEDFL